MRAQRIRAGFVQTHPHFGQVSSNLERVERLVDAAPPFDLLVLPELFSTGYLFRDREEVASLAEPDDGPTVQSLLRLARERQALVVGGWPERAGDRVFNSAVLAAPDGSIRTYRKIHLFDREMELFDAGDRPFATWDVETAAGTLRIGVMICFDWVFPESARCLAVDGAELIAHPSNLVLAHCQDAMKTRCLENGVFAVTANRIADDDRGDLRLSFTGRSQIVDPRGTVLVRASDDREEIEVEEIDLEFARDKKITGRNDLLRDRRPARYPNLG